MQTHPSIPPPSPSIASAHTASVHAASVASHIPLLQSNRSPEHAERPLQAGQRKLTKPRPFLPPIPSGSYAHLPENAGHNGNSLNSNSPQRRSRRVTLNLPPRDKRASDDGDARPSSILTALTRWSRWRTADAQETRADTVATSTRRNSMYSSTIPSPHTGRPTSAAVEPGNHAAWGSVKVFDAFNPPQRLLTVPWSPTWQPTLNFKIHPHDDNFISPEATRILSNSPSSIESSLDDEYAGSASRRPRLVRRDAGIPPTRRWTLAMVMKDEAVSNETLVQCFERIRLRSGWATEDDAVEAGVWEVGAQLPLSPSSLPSLRSNDSDSKLSSESSPFLPTSISSPPFLASARRSLLTARELVYTERRYLSSLYTLLLGQTTTPPPSKMLKYVRDLAKVSNDLLARMEDDPSVWGLAAAFLEMEDYIEHVFVAWCGVVGTWFSKDGSHRRKLSKNRHSLPVELVQEALNLALRQSTHAWDDPTMPDSVHTKQVFVAPGITGLRNKDSDSISLEKVEKAAKPTVRELAILPTQRVTRYTLLYRSLLDHTPPASPSRILLERTVEVTSRIAHKCDEVRKIIIPPKA